MEKGTGVGEARILLVLGEMEIWTLTREFSMVL